MPASLERPTTRPRALALAAALSAACLTIGTVTAAPAHADTTAATGDESVHVPTAWISYYGQTAAQVSSRLGSTYRLVDLHQSSPGIFTFTAVQNAGAYAVPGWWWYYNVTPTQVSAFLTANNGRLITAERNADGTMNVVMVSNTGASARGWWWYYGQTAAQINARVSANNARLVSLDQEPGGTYTAVMVPNTGADAKSWWYYYNVTPAQVSSFLTTNGARIVDLDAVPGQPGRFNVVMVRQTGTDAAAWKWYYGTSLNSIVSIAAQTGYRLFDAQPYASGSSTVWAGVMIDNLDAENRRIENILESGWSASGLSGARYGYLVKPINGTPTLALQSGSQYEPASAIKALYNLYAERRIQLGADALGNSFTYWYDPAQPTNKDVCPLNYTNTTSNRTITTLADGLNRMMGVSDNRTTQGVDLRYGRANVNAYAAAIGMSGTQINQTLGCGIKNGGFVRVTLNDMTRMYEGVQTNTLLSSTRSASFFGRMNGGTMPASGQFATMVAQEAAALGKSGVAASFTANVRWRVKGGSYDMCFTSGACNPPYDYVRANSGIMSLPLKSSTGAITLRSYAYGWWVNDLRIPCSFGATCAARTQADSVTARLDTELFRAQVRAALATW